MEKDKENEIQSLLDGIEFDLNEAKMFINNAEDKRREIVELLKDKQEEF